MRRRGVLLSVLLGAALCACSREAQPRTRALLDSAARVAFSGDHLQAARMLRAAIADVAPADRGQVLLVTAGHYHRAGLHLDCLEQVEACLREGVADPEALYLQGESLRLLQRQADAERILA